MPRTEKTLDIVSSQVLKGGPDEGIRCNSSKPEKLLHSSLGSYIKYIAMLFGMPNVGGVFLIVLNWVMNGLKGIKIYVDNLFTEYMEMQEEHQK